LTYEILQTARQEFLTRNTDRPQEKLLNDFYINDEYDQVMKTAMEEDFSLI
jgi:hypothetical protein